MMVAEKPVRLRFGGYQPERSVHTRAARALGGALQARLPGRVAFELTAQIMQSGRAAADLLTLTEAGDLEMCYFASSYLANRVPELSVLDLPFQGADRDSIWRRLDGEAGNLIKAAVAARTGYEVLAFWDNGVRHVSNGVRALQHPRDCAGLSIRTLDSAFHKAIFAALGFAPRFIDVKDLGAAVADRTIDAQENPLTNLINFELYKSHRFVSLTAHFHGIALVLANAAALRAMAPEVRVALDDAVAAATVIQRAAAAEEDAACLAALLHDGVAIAGAGDIDHAAFKAAVAAVVARETTTMDPALVAAWTR